MLKECGEGGLKSDEGGMEGGVKSVEVSGGWGGWMKESNSEFGVYILSLLWAGVECRNRMRMD